MFLYSMSPRAELVYDIETYPNCFTFAAVDASTKCKYLFEISDRVNQIDQFCKFIDYCKEMNTTWTGFNNLGFDHIVVHFIYKHRDSVTISVHDIYEKAMQIIRGNSFAHMVWENDWLVNQIDLFKIHHFDNGARATSLKVLEFNMRLDQIEDLPFPVGTVLTDEQKDVLIAYNWDDVDATLQFRDETEAMIQFRQELSKRYGKNFTNHNDTKIGKDYFIMEIEKANEGSCYYYQDGKRKMRQTPRDSINLADVIFDYVKFNHAEFTRIMEFFKSQVIRETKGVFKNINCTVNGFTYDFGVGGIHGSVESSAVLKTTGHTILDIDVKSYYPNIAIANRLHPEHLAENFCDLYKTMYLERVEAQKAGNSEVSAMLKLALNGVYGDSNNEYSPFYDPQYTMSITINGQLLLCMLADALQHKDVEMIQINTDGLTIKHADYLGNWVRDVCRWWENITNLTLEFAEYKAMFIRDVNNYLALGTDGKVKRKGAYEYELAWHQNQSALIVAKAVEAHLIHGRDVREFIQSHQDVFDFFLRAKVPRSSRLEWGGEQIQNTTRYYISKTGKPLEKVMPPNGPEGAYKRANGLTDSYFNQIKEEVGDKWDERIHTKNKSTYTERRTGINTGWVTKIANRINTYDVADYTIDYEWYIKEAEKLIDLKEQ